MTPVLVVLRSTPLLCRAALGVPCARCAVGPGDPCVTTEVPSGVHLSRMATAVKAGLISMAEFVPLMQDDFHPGTEIPDGSWRKHPLDLHPGDPIILEPHQVRDEIITRSEPVTVDAPPEMIRADVVRLYWRDLRGRAGVTCYQPTDWIHLRRTA